MYNKSKTSELKEEISGIVGGMWMMLKFIGGIPRILCSIIVSCLPTDKGKVVAPAMSETETRSPVVQLDQSKLGGDGRTRRRI